MAEEKSLIVKIAVPVVILFSLVLSGTCGYLGWIDTAALNTQPEFTSLMQMIAYMSFGIASFLTFGTLAKHYRFTQEELDRWGDDAMSGKPPL